MSYNALRGAVEQYGRRMDDIENRATIWKMAFIVTLVALLVAVCVNVYLAIQSDIRPYVVKMKDTEIIKVSPLEELSTPTVYEIKEILTDFIDDLRSVVGDADYQRKLLDRVYAHIEVGSKAYNSLNQWYAANNPFDRAKTIRVIPHDITVSAVGGRTFLIEWQEDYKQIEGAIFDTNSYRATVSIDQGKLTKESEILKNAFGLFVTEIDWGEHNGISNTGDAK